MRIRTRTSWYPLFTAASVAVLGCGRESSPSEVDGPNRPPTVSISSPVNGFEVLTIDSLTLSAGASDPEEGDLSSRIEWTSSVDGPLGSGATLHVRLSLAEHVLTASVRDRDGLTASAGRTVDALSARWLALSAGVSHTCGVVESGAAYCWGENAVGALGTSTPEGFSDRPVPVTGEISFREISAANAFTCGTSDTDMAYCWGANTSGQLGDGTDVPRSAPGVVAGGLSWSVVGAGSQHACGVTLAGEAYCWGDNYNAVLSVGIDSATPVAVAGTPPFDTLVVGIAHACGLDAGGAAYCWGFDDQGQLGDGEPKQFSTPVVVSGTHQFVALSAGWNHTCGLLSDGQAFCWGANSVGQLGDGGTEPRSSPVAAASGLRFREIVAGETFTCGLDDAGAAYCWGWNDQGQLGVGTFGQTVTPPTPVAGGHTFRSLAAGRTHMCGIRDDGTAMCWGWNADGQIGDGGRGTSVAVPILVGP